MDVREFFAALAEVCDEGKCPQCGARIFCYTAPRSMTNGIISQAIEIIAKKERSEKHEQ